MSKHFAGFHLRRSRKAMGMTQAELGKTIGVTNRTISYWERGEKPIPGAVKLLIPRLLAEHEAANA